MNVQKSKELFEKDAKSPYESVKLTFKGVEGFDVYNPSIPFMYEGKIYLFGRVERREDWARSWTRLFTQTDQDEWTLVKDSMIYPLEDPFIQKINDELVLGGTHVQYQQGKIDTFYGYFYRGVDLRDLYYFTTGPDRMKDIRLVQLHDGRIGVFSRPRGEDIRATYGSESLIGFTMIDRLGDLSAEVVSQANIIEGLFGKDEWGGCNQCYLLSSGLIGIIAHKSYQAKSERGDSLLVYVNVAFVFDPEKHEVIDEKVIATRSSYPKGPAKNASLIDCAFPSGIVKRLDGKVDLYSGLSDTEAGRVTIDDPFRDYGEIEESSLF